MNEQFEQYSRVNGISDSTKITNREEKYVDT